MEIISGANAAHLEEVKFAPGRDLAAVQRGADEGGSQRAIRVPEHPPRAARGEQTESNYGRKSLISHHVSAARATLTLFSIRLTLGNSGVGAVNMCG
jgi:hypothetical protein